LKAEVEDTDMTPDTTVRDDVSDQASLLNASVKVPRSVVYRSFPSETVVLNLETGKYHGLNASAGRMLDELERTVCVQDAANALAQSYAQPLEVIERDVCELCQALIERGLIEVDGGASN
jgi:hypothetical protein